MNQPAAQPTVNNIKLVNALALLASLTILPIISQLIWALYMKQYKTSVINRLLVAGSSAIIGSILLWAGFLISNESSVFVGLLVAISGLVIYVGPFFYTFMSAGSKTAK